MDINNLDRIDNWKGIFPIAISWITIWLAILISEKFFWLYPLALIVIVNRIMVLGLLAHEGIHGLLNRKMILNDFLARYFCSFPVFISLSKWRIQHDFHHRFVGTSLDYDKYLYTYYPVAWREFFRAFLSGTMLLGHFYYFTDLDSIIRQFGIGRFNLFQGAQKIYFEKSDRVPFFIFHFTLLALVVKFGVLKYYFLFWLLPFCLCQPMTLLYNCIEHTKIYEVENVNHRSRTVLGGGILLPIVLPLNVNYHGEHHLFPRVPQYNLPKLSLIINNSDSNKLYRQSLSESLEAVFNYEK